jgi:hypothetical protein
MKSKVPTDVQSPEQAPPAPPDDHSTAAGRASGAFGTMPRPAIAVKGPVGRGESGGDPEGARAVRGDLGAVAGKDEQGADRADAVAAAAAGVAIEPASAVGNDRGAAGAAADADTPSAGCGNGSGGDRARIAGPGFERAAQGDHEAEARSGGESAGERTAEAIPADARSQSGGAACAAHEPTSSQAEPVHPASRPKAAGESEEGC